VLVLAAERGFGRGTRQGWPTEKKAALLTAG
jgi:hypothetical protein